jgi:hypothetical protein
MTQGRRKTDAGVRIPWLDPPSDGRDPPGVWGAAQWLVLEQSAPPFVVDFTPRARWSLLSWPSARLLRSGAAP